MYQMYASLFEACPDAHSLVVFRTRKVGRRSAIRVG